MKFSKCFCTILSLLLTTHQQHASVSAASTGNGMKQQIRAGSGVYSFAFAPSLDDRLKELHRRTEEMQEDSEGALEESSNSDTTHTVCDEGFDDDEALASNSMAVQYGLTNCRDTYDILLEYMGSSDMLCMGIGAGLCNCTCAGIEVQASLKLEGIPYDETPSIDLDGSAEGDSPKLFSCEDFAMMDISSLELLPDYLEGSLGEWKCTELGKVGILLWKTCKGKITFAVELLSSGGGAGIGVSANGGMKGADFLVVSKTDEEEWHLQDMFSTGYAYDGSLVTLDDSQDGRLEWADEDDDGERIAFAVTRSIVSCDAEEDLEILGGPVPLIWARFPSHGVFYHGPGKDSRGTIYLNLLSEDGEKTQGSSALPEDTKDLFTLDLRVTSQDGKRYELPDEKINTYACKSFELPTDQAYHIVSYESILDTVNTDANVVHHVVIYSCDADPFYQEARGCGEGMAATCQSVEVSWAVGMPAQYLPPKAGIPLNRFVLLEMHYENLAEEKGVMDGSGLRLTITPQLREEDFGYLFLGTSLSDTPALEPGQKSLSRRGYCPAECLARHMPASGIQTHGQLFHTHLQGRSLYTHHYRQQQDKVQEEEIVIPGLFGEMPYYDFNHQSFKYDDDEAKLYRGDALVTTCFYNTEDQQNATGFGLETRDEMCFVVVGVYPKIDLKYCWNSSDTGGYCASADEGDLSWDYVESPLPAGSDSYFASSSAFDLSSNIHDRCLDIDASMFYSSSAADEKDGSKSKIVGVIVCILFVLGAAYGLLSCRLQGRRGDVDAGLSLHKVATAKDGSSDTMQDDSGSGDIETKEVPKVEQALAEAY